MREETNKYGVLMSNSDAYWLDISHFGNSKYVLKRAYKECGCEKNDDCCCDECFEGWGDKAQEVSCFDAQLKPNRRRLLLLKR
jgi:hypothetical protein